jgi:uncharacterized OB-fold protein
MNQQLGTSDILGEGIPIEEGFYRVPKTPDQKPVLIGSRCTGCGEVYFPNVPQCLKCYTETTQTYDLQRVGRVYSSTVVHLAPPLYQGKVPYAIGHVELDNGVLVPTRFTEVGESPLPVGMEVELVLEKLGKDGEGKDIIVHAFRPVRQ